MWSWCLSCAISINMYNVSTCASEYTGWRCCSCAKTWRVVDGKCFMVE